MHLTACVADPVHVHHQLRRFRDPMAIRICISGVTGWTGSAVARAVIASTDFQLVGAVARRDEGQKVVPPNPVATKPESARRRNSLRSRRIDA